MKQLLLGEKNTTISLFQTIRNMDLFIYGNGGGYSYTDPVIGGEHSVNPFENGIPGPYEGYIHSHGDKSPGYKGEDFSKADSKIVNTYGKPGYLVTPSGVLKKKPPLSPPVIIMPNIKE